MGQLLQAILWQRQKKRQLVAAGTGLALGMAFVLLAMQLYLSTRQTFSAEQRPESQYEYLILNKPVSGLNSLSLLSKRFGAAFKPYEWNALAEQPFIVDVAPFTTNQFSISSNLQEEMGMYADLFFEAVPDAFLDTLPPDWGWEEGDTFLPVIMNKDWLDLYNFNVAVMYNLPQLSEESVKELNFRVRVAGQGQTKLFSSKVVAFSYRLPSLMIPLSFMEWGNKNFGEKEDGIYKLMVAVEDAADPDLKAYLQEKGFEANTEKTGRQSFRAIAQATASLIGVIGALFILLSILLVTITLQLLISRAKDEVAMMIILGYAPTQVQSSLLRQAARLLVPSLLAGAVLFAITAITIHQWLGPQVATGAPIHLLTILTGLGIVGLTFLLAQKSIQQSLQKSSI